MPPESSYKSTLRPEDFAPRPGFNISIVSILVYLAGIAVHFFMYGGRERVMAGGPTAGLVIGGYVAIFLLATLISYFAFAAVPSRVASAIVFCLAVPALVFGDMKVNTLADAKINPAPIVKATPPPAATPAVIPGNPTYSGSQREKYISQASNAFTPMRHAKIQALTDAINALQGAGMMSPKGLTSKEEIANRRKLVETARLANEDYITFVNNQEAIYRTELEKTPLVPNDVNVTVNQFVAKNPNVADTLAVRTTERDLLKSTDDILAALDGMWGRWRLKDGKALFEKAQDSNQYGKMLAQFNTLVAAQMTAQAKLTADQAKLTAEQGGGMPEGAPAGSPSAAATPAPAAAASVLTGTVAPAASVAPIAPPADTVAPAGSPAH